MVPNRYDIALIGGGIVGASTAWQLKRRFPDATLLLVEKEPSLAKHQTGHNSGVIHAGVYYQPGSLKADFCRRGAVQTIEFCRQHGLPFERCGKLLVATDEVEINRMEALEQRCKMNGIETRRVGEEELKKMEPNIAGKGALLVAATGITDYTAITEKMAALFTGLKGRIQTAAEVHSLKETTDGVRFHAGDRWFQARYLIVCGGLMADRLAKMMGIDIDFQIVPFRGEYYRLAARHNRIVRHLIYPIPDPELPFLGVHLTRMIDGSVTVGPNAVVGWKREGYGRFNFNLTDTLEMLSYSGFWRVIAKNFSTGLSEIRDSFSKAGYLKRVQKYCPGLAKKDLQPIPAGVRAQAVKRDGSLVHDFLFAETQRSLHVCNAPSPAATSAMPIGEYLCNKVVQTFSL